MNWTVLGSAGPGDAREGAVRALYEDHGGSLHTYVQRLVGGDRYRAEDIVQETLLRCWRKRALDDGSSVRPWAFRVARNIVIDEYRQRQARPQEVGGNVWLDERASEFDDIEQAISSVMIGEALSRLSATHRTVLYQMYFVGRTTQEVAEELGVPVGTVKSRLHYALRQLRQSMRDAEGLAPAGDARGKPVGASR
ncbi:sigma-70 family RNA polymerase sigma factor [Phaeacidiphilus oryzae]|uniref:sigma-70 family RNA polymerase sigma factor n=1 Tax=Phaeacidiphilus oryzae TaxID=348818 RepID=UPI00068DCB9F|nr:sigma-70 family RNA polymerase sigma factor [Phaeacidiphilus oryzae]